MAPTRRAAPAQKRQPYHSTGAAVKAVLAERGVKAYELAAQLKGPDGKAVNPDLVRALTRDTRPSLDMGDKAIDRLKIDEAALVRDLEETFTHNLPSAPVRVQRRLLDQALQALRTYEKTGVMPGQSKAMARAKTPSRTARVRVVKRAGVTQLGRVQPPPPSEISTPRRLVLLPDLLEEGIAV